MINYRKWCKHLLQRFTIDELLLYIHSNETCPCKASYRICFTCEYSNDDNDICNDGYHFFLTFSSLPFPRKPKTKQIDKLKIKLLEKVLKRL